MLQLEKIKKGRVVKVSKSVCLTGKLYVLQLLTARQFASPLTS